jgi:N-acetylglucosamine-6-phosphate deacetylase
MKTLALNIKKLVLRDREEANVSLLIADSRSSAISTRLTKADEQIDLTDCTVFPGFIDVHNHGSVGVDVMESDPSALADVSAYLASCGVTGWLPTLVPASDENYAQVARLIQSAMQNNSGARVLGIHYEGPFVNSAQCGALHTKYFKSYSSTNDLECLHTVFPGTNMITLAPEIEGGLELITELYKRGWVISIGHTRADIKLLEAAFENGARHMTHFMNAMAPLHHRKPGPVNWGLLRDDVTCDIIADGIHLDSSMLRLLVKTKGAGRLALISDAIAAAGKGDGEYQIWGETISVKEGRTSNAAGSIAGSVISMFDAVRMMRSLGVPDVDVARMASLNPARLLQIDDQCGSIEEGKRADLVAIDDHGKVRLTIIGGEVVYRAGNEFP